ncbi:ABC transporter permease [Brevibacillus brevis]|uniref:ABC transporter permease n=1 Tax=Brevibacillus brevis TaxID=1393 RepID=UPI000D0F87F5|nr:ABC transporter permease [Brevibacillus brevis]PSJ69055.1 peptide ABC transporter [Brevibacillus brevis]RED33015.1 peptide/nickel transport system permease protein [Brevibacillus brevis]GEC90394.1 peptide ABC transporter permease [Brevibacillus brevis]VEF90685.1 Glutathione transport system permease protein gsiC [Brevibacillus brevis]
MGGYLLKRVVSLLPVLLVVAVVDFIIIHLTPGDPASVILGAQATEEELAKLREQLGLNLPIYIRFFEWIGGLLQGDLGWSIFMDKPVTEAIWEHLGPTLSLTIMAEIIAILFAIPLGVMAANRRGTWMDQSFMTFALLGISLPSFWIGLNLILLFAVQLNWLPAAGYQPISKGLLNHFKYLIMPAISLGIMQGALIARMTRSSMLEVLNENYIRTAEAKGLKLWIVTYKHALRNAFIPILTVIGLSFATLIGGAVVTETVFNIPGIGKLIVNSVLRRDYEVIQGTVLMIAAAYVLINLIVDLLYAYIDPRVRYDKS